MFRSIPSATHDVRARRGSTPRLAGIGGSPAPAIPRRRATLAGLGVMLLAGCATRSPLPANMAALEPMREPEAPGPVAPLEAAADPDPRLYAREAGFLALSLVDTPYRWGGNTPDTGFDCSGLIVYVFREAAGLALPRTVAQLARVGERVSTMTARTGDLVFFHTTGRYSHAGIYVGSGRFVHAPSAGGRVRLDGIAAPWWRERVAAIRRV